MIYDEDELMERYARKWDNERIQHFMRRMEHKANARERRVARGRDR